MSSENFIDSTFYKYLKKGSIIAILIVIIGLFLDSYNIISLDNFKIPYLRLVLWIYLIANAGIATPFHYIKSNSEKNPRCPHCNKKLSMKPQYECPSCGKLNFNKK